MIEPLGSVTVLQAEPYKAQVQPAPVETATEGAKIDSQPMVDTTTKAVACSRSLTANSRTRPPMSSFEKQSMTLIRR